MQNRSGCKMFVELSCFILMFPAIRITVFLAECVLMAKVFCSNKGNGSGAVFDFILFRKL